MKINIFEGARRIALLIGAIWIIGCLAYAIISEPYSKVTFKIHSPGMAPALMETACASDDASEYIDRSTPDGQSVNISLCFIAHKSTDGRMLIPYADSEDGKAWVMNEKYSTQVSQYKKTVAQAFQLTSEGAEAARKADRAALLKQWKEAVLAIFIGLTVGVVFVSAVGWIVRGFMGIPRGHDMRPNT